MKAPLLLGFALSLALSGCRSSSEASASETPTQGSQVIDSPLDRSMSSHQSWSAAGSPVLPAVPAPLSLDGKAFDAAGAMPLPEVLPEASDGLYNVYRLSENIVSGSEPSDERALRHLRDIGVRTILSVDGKQPDAATAERLGMRYVHIPIQYSDIDDEELAQIAKSFRELEGPFYIHCFHGKHRGPAAAAVGRVVLDGASRESAIAEMRQYCGTSSKYEGLYRVVATRDLPTLEETSELDYDFASNKRPEGIVGVMVHLARSRDTTVALRDRAWEIDPEHPDVDPRNEAEKLRDAYASSLELSEVQNGPTDQKEWFEASHREANALVEALERFHAGDAKAGEEASAHVTAIRNLCSECHASYRN